jgi:hypothetical protein
LPRGRTNRFGMFLLLMLFLQVGCGWSPVIA